MRRKENRYITGPNVPLLEQEKIKNILSDGPANQRKKNHTLRKLYFTAFLSISVILLIGFLILNFGNLSLGNGNNSITSNVNGDIESITSENDIDVMIPTVTTGKDSVTTEVTDIYKDLYEFDYSNVPDGDLPIVPKDMSFYTNGATYITNLTGLIPDAKALLSANLSIKSNLEFISYSNEPKVLILHTHTSEAYADDGAVSYSFDGEEFMRSEDPLKNVVSIGKYMAELLQQNGVPTVHCTIDHDSVQYKDSFSRSNATVKEYMKRYPSIKLVIDLHRDTLLDSNGDIIRPVTLVDGEKTAQIRCVVGSDWGGEIYPTWENNLSLALKLRERLNSKYHNICRPPELREVSYNQELAPFSLMIEIGSCGNSIEEAKRSVECISSVLAEIISEI